MYRLPLIIVFLLLSISLMSQSLHGENMTMDCALCHTPDGWTVDLKTIAFDHNETKFELEGTHTMVDCKMCHPTLVFDEAPSDCISCHGDIHSMTVGNDCKRCHNAETWLVDIIPELHEENGFPLIGAHSSLSCDECHISDTYLRFDRLGNECINCHRDDYETSQSPNHISAGYSTDCLECHSPLGFGWDANAITHGFFPLTQGHEIADCNECHTSGSFSDLSSECITCHQMDYDNTLNPNHSSAQFSTDCASCHTTEIGWTPATFDHDAEFFPIYSGEHDGEWNECIDCHTNPSNYGIFTCISCHTNPEMDDEHGGVDGYIFEDNACFACHPTGEKEGSFDHSSTQFMLTNGHFGVDCIECHSNGYQGTSMYCNDCHNVDFLNTTNPDHEAIGIAIDCVDCHTTDLGWMPASFDNHNDYYPLNGAHASAANECILCHEGEYNNTPNTCIACHQDEYDNASNPDHNSLGLSNDCISCHTTDPDWAPASFDNHNDFYALNGAHATISNDCAACHNGDYVNTGNTCIACHQDDYNSTSDPNHSAAQFNTDCFICHNESAWDPSTFDHDSQYMPIYSDDHEGEWSSCTECHINQSNYQVFYCLDCHGPDTADEHDDEDDYEYLSTACYDCHY